jgi:hypothetical protein
MLLILFSLQPLLHSEENLHSVWAIKDCRIVPLSSPPIEKGVVVLRDGLIEAVGASVSIPPDAEVLDGSKLTVYPGLTDALGQSLLKLPEEKFDTSKIYSGEFTDKDRGIIPELRAFDYVNLGKAALEKCHRWGITGAHVMPQRGILTGQASVFSLSSSDKNKALLHMDGALGIGFSPGVFMTYPNSLMGVIAYLRQELTDASHYKMKMDSWKKGRKGLARSAYCPRMEILSTYASGKKPVVFLCRSQHDIRRALSLASELKLNFLICDLGNEAFKVIPELKKAKARVLCTLTFKAPATSVHAQLGKEERQKAEEELYSKNPAKLAEAGIPFAFSSLGNDDPKSFMEAIQKAIENGLPREKALEALTVQAASFLGLEQSIGTLEPGKIANLALVEGDILTKEAKVRYVFADGQRFELKEAKVKEGEKPTVNVTGKWEFLIEAGPGTMKLTVDFIQEEASLSGTITSPLGISDFTGGSVAGNEIYFEMILSVGGQEIDLYFSAVVEGDTMEGTVVQGTAGSAEFTGKRIPS